MKMRSKKWISLLLVFLLAVGLFSGCGSTENEENSNATNATNDANVDVKENDEEVQDETPVEKTKIVWWTHSRHDMDFMQEKIDAFMAENPDIEIEYVIQTENFPQNLELAFQSGDSPDIFSMRLNAKHLTDRGMIHPLDEYITDGHRERFGDLLYVEGTNYVNGSTYSFPNIGNVFRAVYNKDLMDKVGISEVPRTLSEYAEFVKAVTEAGQDEGEYGFAINLQTPGPAFLRSIDKIAEASGLQPYDYTTGKYDFGRMKPIIETFRQMYAEGHMFPGVEALSIDPLRSQFAEGKIGTYISAHWEVGVYNNQFPTDVNWIAAPVPIADGTEGNNSRTGITGGAWQGISSESEVKDESFRVLDYFYSEDILVEYQEAGLGFSVVPGVIAEADEPELYGAEYFMINEEIDALFPTSPATFGFSTSKDMKVEGKEYHDIFTEVILGVLDLDEAIEDLNTRYNAANEQAIADGQYEAIIIEDFGF